MFGRLLRPKIGLRFYSSIEGLNHEISKLPRSNNSEILTIIKKLQNFRTQVNEGDKFSNIHHDINQSIINVLNDESLTFNNDLLGQLMRLKLPTDTNINIISTFYNRNPQAIIDKKTALIPFRSCLFNGDIANALKITDMTTGHPNYINHNDRIFKKGIVKLIGSSISISIFSRFGIEELIQLGIISSGWSHLSSISSLIITYLINSTFLMTIVKLGRTVVANGGDYLTWQKGTFYTHWFNHADEMMMCSKIVETDIKLNGGGTSGGELSPELREELCRINPHNAMRPVGGYDRSGKKIRLLSVKDNLEDIKLQAYWMSGGEGFEWVEPDQDPADILWSRNLQQQTLGNNNTKSIKWAEQLLE